MSVLNYRIIATITDAPASGATFTSRSIPLRRDTAFGAAATASLLDLYYYHEGQTSEYNIEGSEDSTNWFIVKRVTGVAAHVAGGAGLFDPGIRVPHQFARVKVKNTGGGAVTAFQVIASAQNT